MAAGGKILLVEDDPAARDLLSQFFQEKGCQIAMAENGKEAIEKMSQGPFDLIFLDLNMPVMSGLEALPHLRDRDQKVHIVITTAFASYESKIEAREHGVRDYLVKPITLSKIQELAEKYLPKSADVEQPVEESRFTVGLDLTKLDVRVAHLVPESLARTHFLIPVMQHQNVLTVAMADPGNQDVINQLHAETGYTILSLNADRGDILEAINQAYSHPPLSANIPAEKSASFAPEPEKQINPTPATMVIGTPSRHNVEVEQGALTRLAAILIRASERQAQEIHIDPLGGKVLIRLRAHGRLEALTEISAEEYRVLQNAILTPNGGRGASSHARNRVHFTLGTQAFTYTYHLLPTVLGDSMLIYLHDPSASAPDVWNLDMDSTSHSRLIEALKRGTGMICLTGLPGHAHMTTCYAALHYVSTSDSKTITLEHSVGLPVPGLTQVPLRSEIGQTYEDGLREVLLHNPDVIALEEIPDRVTTSLALHASAAGRLVITTMYAADTVACLSTLLRIGISPLLLSRTLTLLLAQYRLRRICPNCKTATPPSDALLKRLTGVDKAKIPPTWFFGAGCEQCGMTGFQGQVMIYEALPVTPSLQQGILDETTGAALFRHAQLTGYTSLLDAGFQKVGQGLTTMDELLATVPAPYQS